MNEEKIKSFDEIEEITCPHCGENQSYEMCDNGEDFVTYWGEEIIEQECRYCRKKFFVQERVIRDWEVVKEISDL